MRGICGRIRSELFDARRLLRDRRPRDARRRRLPLLRGPARRHVQGEGRDRLPDRGRVGPPLHPRRRAGVRHRRRAPAAAPRRSRRSSYRAQSPRRWLSPRANGSARSRSRRCGSWYRTPTPCRCRRRARSTSRRSSSCCAPAAGATASPPVRGLHVRCGARVPRAAVSGYRNAVAPPAERNST